MCPVTHSKAPIFGEALRALQSWAVSAFREACGLLQLSEKNFSSCCPPQSTLGLLLKQAAALKQLSFSSGCPVLHFLPGLW